MALVSDNTTATGYGQAPKPAPQPAALSGAPIPTYNGYVDDSTAYTASVLGTVPPVAGGGPVITVPDAPLYRDPKNPAVVFNEQYQRWYDTDSGLWRDGDYGVWTNFDRTQVWNPNTGKMQATSSLTITPKSDIQPTAAGMAAAKALIQGGGKNTILTTPDRPKAASDFAALSSAPDPFEGIIPSPYMTPGKELPGTLYDMGDGTFATGTDATGWEYLTEDELNAKYAPQVVKPNIGPEVGAAIDLAYGNVMDSMQREQQRSLEKAIADAPYFEGTDADLKNLPSGKFVRLRPEQIPYDVPIGNSNVYYRAPNGTIQPVEQFLDFGGMQSLLPESVTNRLPNPDWFPLESAVEFGTSPYGAMTYAASIAAGLVTGGTGAAAVGGTAGAIARAAAIQAGRGVAANFAGDLLGEAAANYAARLPEAAQLNGVTPFVAGVIGGGFGEAYAVRSLDKAIVRVPGTPFTGIDDFVGREVIIELPDVKDVIRGTDIGPGTTSTTRAVLLPSGHELEVPKQYLSVLPAREPLTITRQIDEALSDAPLGDARMAMAFPDDTPVVPNLRPVSAVDERIIARDGTVTYKGEVLGKVERSADGRWQAVDVDGVSKTHGTKAAAADSLANDFDVARGMQPVRSLVLDTRRAVDMSKPAEREMADAIAAAVIDPNPATVERASWIAFSRANEVDHVGFNLADIAYVLGKDAEGNPITAAKLAEYRKIDELARNGIINPRTDPMYRLPKDLLNDEYRVRTGGTYVKNAKGEWKVEGGRSPGWLLPKGARPNMYETREMQQAWLREVGQDSAEIRAVLPEGPGLRAIDDLTGERTGEYLHGSLASYMNYKDWRKTIELERAALNAKSHDELIRLKLEQAKIAGVNFNPFDPRTSYGLFSVADNAAAKRAANAAVKGTPLDVAVEGSAAHGRAVKAALGSASPVEMALHEGETRAIADAVLKETPEAVIPTRPQMLGLIEDSKPDVVKRTSMQRARSIALDVAATPFVGLRSLLLAGDSIIGRQLWGAGVLYPKQTTEAIINTLRNVRNRDALWRYVADTAEQRPHLAPYLVTKGTPGSLEETITVASWINRGKWNPLAQIEDINGLMKNLVRINLDKKLVNMSEGLTERQIAARAEYIAVITGRGAGKFLDNHASKLNATLFISSRYTASRFQFMGLILPFHEGYTGVGINAFSDPKLYKAHMARMMAASTVAATLYTLLGEVPGVETVTDSRSSKFGKFKWRDQWYDFTGAYTDPIRLFSQMASGTGISESGNAYSFGNGLTGAFKALQGYIEARIPPANRIVAEWAGYVSPFTEKPMFKGQPGWVNRYVPLPVSSLVEMWRETNDAGDGFWNTINTGLTFAGFGINPMGDKAKWEKAVITDRAAQKALQDDVYWKPGSSRKSFDDLSKTGLAYVSANPQIFGAKPETSMAEFRRNAQIVADGRAAARVSQLADDYKLTHGELSPKDWRRQESIRAKAVRDGMSGVYGEWEGEPSDDIVDRYFAAIDDAEYTVGTDAEGNPILEIDWDAVDRFESRMSADERAALDRYFEIQNGKGTEVQQELDIARKVIDDSGFWNLKDSLYETWRLDHPELPETYDEWRDATFQAAYDAALAETGSAGIAYKKASTAQSALESSMGFTDAYKNTVLYPWVQANPEAAKAAVDWQYYTPDGAAEKALFGEDATEIATKVETYQVKTQVEPLYKPAITSAWHTWAAANVSVTLSDGRTPSNFETVNEWNEAYRADALAAKEKELGRPLSQTEENAVIAATATVTDVYQSNTKKDGGTSVRYVNSSGTSTTGYLSQASVAELNAIAAAYKQNPEQIKRAFALGLIVDIGTMDKAYLASLGVVLE